jgi:predicted alpha/beta-fold hydrolase
MGGVGIRGELREVPGDACLFVLVHGLGGFARSTYILRSARAFAHHGLSTLAINLRGADRCGEDFYNVALVEDLEAALAHPRLAHFERIHLIGYSMGGYNSLHCARVPRDPRLKAVVALCTPLDLSAAQRYIDAPRAYLYRRHVLSGLKSIYACVARSGRPVPNPDQAVQAVRTIHEWDRLTIAPRYGFTSPEHYYEALSIRPHLKDLRVPALLLLSDQDPVVPAHTSLPHVPKSGPLEVRHAARSGHLAFERNLDLGQAAKLGLEAQIAAWCLSH